VSLTALADIDNLYIGGGFGFAAAKLADGSVIAAWVDASGPAYAAGLRPGAVLSAWNQESIGEALKNIPTLFGGSSATTENLELKQVQSKMRQQRGKESPWASRTSPMAKRWAITAPTVLSAWPAPKSRCRAALPSTFRPGNRSGRIRISSLTVGTAAAASALPFALR
jgi:hypothetical protein